jgi:hypothetical protein
VPKVTVPAGSASRGLGNGASQVDLAVAAQVTRDSLQTYANIAYWINNGSDNRNYWFVGAQAQYAADDESHRHGGHRPRQAMAERHQRNVQRQIPR